MLSNSFSEVNLLRQPIETTKLEAPLCKLFSLQETPCEPCTNLTLLIGAHSKPMSCKDIWLVHAVIKFSHHYAKLISKSESYFVTTKPLLHLEMRSPRSSLPLPFPAAILELKLLSFHHDKGCGEYKKVVFSSSLKCQKLKNTWVSFPIILFLEFIIAAKIWDVLSSLHDIWKKHSYPCNLWQAGLPICKKCLLHISVSKVDLSNIVCLFVFQFPWVRRNLKTFYKSLPK